MFGIVTQFWGKPIYHENIYNINSGDMMVFVSSLSLVFPNRTFFLYADSKEEMQEWIDLLTWKLVRFRENV